jgi:hypothetical protein
MADGTRIAWSGDMIAKLVSMRGAGRPLDECAHAIGVCYSVTRRKAAELGLNGRLNRGRVRGSHVEAIVAQLDALPDLRSRGFSLTECAIRLGVAYEVVAARVHQLGLPRRLNRGSRSGVDIHAGN